MQSEQNLLRRQYLVTPENVRKLQVLAESKRTSAAEIVRQAIEAYEPNEDDMLDSKPLMELALSKLREAIVDTEDTRARLNKALASMDAGKPS